MTRADLAAKLAVRLKVTKKEADAYIVSFLDAVSLSLEKDGKASFQGFGTFRIKEYEPRLAKNPETGEMIQIPARQKAVFIPSQDLKDMVNKPEPVHYRYYPTTTSADQRMESSP